MLTHLIAADVRHHRLLLAAWLVIVAATATVDGARPMLTDGALVRTVGVLGSLLSLTQTLLLLVLIPSVVQTHPLVGSNAFWMTRPIPPDILLVSKIVLLGAATVALPTVVESVLMAVYHVSGAQIVSVAAQTALHQTFWMILLMTAAALTPNLMRFALVCGGALVALALFLAVTVAMFMTRMNDLPLAAGGGGGGGTDEPTAGFVLNVLVVVVGLATLVVQFRSRSRLRSVPVAATGLLLAFAIESMWPWPVTREPESKCRHGRKPRRPFTSAQAPPRFRSRKRCRRSRSTAHGGRQERGYASRASSRTGLLMREFCTRDCSCREGPGWTAISPVSLFQRSSRGARSRRCAGSFGNCSPSSDSSILVRHAVSWHSSSSCATPISRRLRQRRGHIRECSK